MKHLCPHCHEECISTMQKLFISSASSRQCRSCEKEVSIAKKYTIAMITVLLLLYFASQLMKLESMYVLVYGSIVAAAFSFIQIRLIPLAKHKIDENR